MKILHVSKYYYPFIGGIEQVARDCITSLHGNEQKIICFNHEKGTRTDIIDGVEVVRVGCFAKIASQSLSMSYGKEFKKVMNDFKPDVVIFHYPNPFASHYLLKYRKRNFKLFVYWHLDIYKQKLLKILFHRQNKKLCNRADVVVGATEKHIYESKYSKYFEHKAKVLPFAIDEDRLTLDADAVSQIEQIRKENQGKIVLFAMGRHVPYKGLGYLIQASKLLGDEFRVYIAGEGPLTPELKEMSKDDKKVKLLGKIPTSTMLAYLNACDIFCFPSITRNEAFGIVQAEAMYFGKPIVNFTIEHSGVNVVSTNGITGIEVENRNVEKYAEAIKELANNEDLRKLYGYNAKERIHSTYTRKQFTDILNTIIKELMQ